MRTNIKRVVLATVLLSSTVVGCQSHTNTASGAQSGSANAAPSASKSAKPIDACSMLSSQDISGLLGVAVQGKSTGSDPQMGDCSWENPSTMESISLQISNPGTARNNTLPPPEAGFPDPSKPGPDGMRLLGGGQVEFAAGNRVNTIQVAVLRLSPDQANSAAIDLARKISPLVPQ
ncbi:hypothetical protein [Mycobacterium paraseoulense]|uniref:hypothetical protein n=1 Tax=Mycobacterium paraseoulense TaxID=590652 RepID=UPI00114FB72A|nr:hypothetical protein [Mycobacterium paraseoulense]MCV7398011.1 hypothetical protein [Mycobacterium paraseoulense]BBZ70252.1 hypothetical protein MPRS_13450 [Mycobacterium paraseoulense]